MPDINSVLKSKIVNHLTDLDKHLTELGRSEVEYSPHLRKPFNKIVEELNNIKMCLEVHRKEDWRYFK